MKWQKFCAMEVGMKWQKFHTVWWLDVGGFHARIVPLGARWLATLVVPYTNDQVFETAEGAKAWATETISAKLRSRAHELLRMADEVEVAK